MNQQRIYRLVKKNIGFVLIVFVAGLLYPATVFSQPYAAADTSKSDPNTIPYKTERSIGYYLLASPSYVMHWISRPVGYAIKYAENEFPHWFEGERGPYGFLPLVEIGGEEGFAAGALLYNDHLFFEDHRARAELLFGSQVYNKFAVEYKVPVRGIENSYLTFDSRYENDPERAYYQNFSDEDLSYATEFGRLAVQYRQPWNSWLRMQVGVEYRDRTIKTSQYEDDLDERIPASLLGSTKLFSVATDWTLNYKNGSRRTLSGTQYIVGGNWMQSAQENDLSFIEYRGEIHHFVPVPMLPETRRLGLKARLQKKVNLGSQSIPFYELSSLGGSRNLRGFPNNRFLDEGFLLFTAEYRYPIWDFMDMVLFTDQGHPFNRYRDLAPDGFRSSYGFGFHLLSSNGLAFRSEFAFSSEGGRFIISIKPNF